MSNTVKLNNCPTCGAPIPADAPQGLCPKCVLLGAAAAAEQGHASTSTAEIPSIARVAAAFPQLEILELIGRGGMGFVFKARQPHLDRCVALKLLPDRLARDPRFAERFGREGRVLAKLNHPNIVSVYDFGSTEHFYFLLMEYVDGVNLRQAMQAGRFSPGEALAIVPRICEALQYAHGQGILHRDIKPENILLDARGQVKIADFGIAKLVGEEKSDVTLTATGAALGTPHYMAPEQLEKPSEVDHRADIYSLGVVFYEMLTGELPIGRFAAPSSKTPVGANVDEVVFRTLEKDRERRYQSVGEMKTQVEHLGTGDVASSSGSGSRAVAEGPVRHSRWAIFGALLVGLSLPVPLMNLGLFLSHRGGIGPVELWLMLGSIALPGLAGTLLGWLGLNEIRDGDGRVRGLPLAMFATLAWPLGILGGLMVGGPLYFFAPAGNLTAANTLGRILMLVLPAGVVTFAFGAIHATGRWASKQPGPRERGVLKWVFLAVLVVGLGAVLAASGRRVSPGSPVAVAGSNGQSAETGEAAVAPMMQFTFTTVDLREENGARWLAMDYVQQTRGNCERTFRYDSSVPGFKVQTKTTSFMTDTKAGFEPVLHQRILWKLPDILPQADAEALRDLVGRERIGKPIVLAPGEEYPLFKTVVANGGSLVAAIGAKTSASENSRAHGGNAAAPRPQRPPDLNDADEGEPAPSRRLQLGIHAYEKDSFRSLSITTDSQLPAGEYLVALRRRPDGGIEEMPASVSIQGGQGRNRTLTHLIWPMSEFDSNRLAGLTAELQALLGGHVIEVGRNQNFPIFSITNHQGGEVAGFISLRSQPPLAAGAVPVSISIVDVPQVWPFFLSVKLRISAPPGYHPRAVGHLNDGTELETHTSLQHTGRGASWAGSLCNWYYPPEFKTNDLLEVVRQLVSIGQTSPQGIQLRSGQRAEVFAVTNQAGTVFRGFFELPEVEGP